MIQFLTSYDTWKVVLVVLAAMWINRVRGTGIVFGLHLRGVPDIWCAPPMALLSWISGQQISPTTSWLIAHNNMPQWPIIWSHVDIWTAVIFALCWLCWSTPAWGTLYRLDFLPPPDRPGTWYERLFLTMAGGNRYLALGLRFVVCLIPMSLIFGVHWLVVGALMVGCYWAGWSFSWWWRTRVSPTPPLDGIPYAEPLTGGLVGLTMEVSGLTAGW